MPVSVETRKLKKPSFAPPEWQVTKFLPLNPYSPDFYLKKIDIGTGGMRYNVIVLDEKVEVIDQYQSVVTQWIYGHHENLPFAQRHQGWQGDEMIRKFNRYEIDFREGTKKIVDREIDLSSSKTVSCNRWGRIL